MKIVHTVAAAALVSLTAACVPPQQTSYPPIQMSAVLTGSQEVPPTASPGSGSANVSYDSSTQRMSWTISYGNLTGPVTGAHFHGPGPSGLNGPVQVPIAAHTPGPLVGSAYLTQAQANDLMAGRMYINLHTPAFPNGEIRGQVVRGVAAVPPAVVPAPVVAAPPAATTTTTTTTTTGAPAVIAPAPAPVVVAPAPVVVPPGQVISSVRNADGSTTVTTRNADGSLTYTTYR